LILKTALRLTAAIASMAAAAAVCVIAAAFALYAVARDPLGPAGAAAVVAVTAAVLVGLIALALLWRAAPKPVKREDLPLSVRLMDLARERPLIAAGAAVAAGVVLLRNPKLLATAITAALAGRATERNDRRRGWGR
jgi:hypothetical protein